jgi:hypothetical protein
LDPLAQWWREEDVLLTEPEPDLAVLDLNARASQPRDAGRGLGVEEQQEGRHSVACFHRVVGEEVARDTPSLIVANEVDRVACRWVVGVEPGEESSCLCPAQEAGQPSSRLRSDRQPGIQVGLGGLGQRPAPLAEPGQESGCFGGLLADSVGCELSGPSLFGLAPQPMQQPPGGVGAQRLLVLGMGRLNELFESHLESSEVAVAFG